MPTRPQIPWGVVRLEFRDEKTVFGAIAPRGPHAAERCGAGGLPHRAAELLPLPQHGREGGQKAGRPWLVLSAWATASPEYFAAYVRNPKVEKSASADARQSGLRRRDDPRLARLLPDIFRGGAATAMTLRMAKMLLVFAVALFYSFVVFNNLTDYDSNYQFVRHVLMMDSTFPGNHGMWRAMNSTAVAHRVLSLDHRLGDA